jgi:zinc/manganese transport system ATP-binding protein
MLILDEPLDSLDLTNQQAIAGIIRRIAKETGAAVLLVAHDINPIISSIDRVVYIARGRVAIGTPAEVISSETLSKLYGSQVEVLRTSDGRLVVVGRTGEIVSYHEHH